MSTFNQIHSLIFTNKYTGNLVYTSVSFGLTHGGSPNISSPPPSGQRAKLHILALCGRMRSYDNEWKQCVTSGLEHLIASMRLSRAYFPSVGDLATFEIWAVLSSWVLGGQQWTQNPQRVVSRTKKKNGPSMDHSIDDSNNNHSDSFSNMKCILA